MKTLAAALAVLVLTAVTAAYSGEAPALVRATGRPAALTEPAATPACNPDASLRPPSGAPQVGSGSFAAKIKARGYLIVGVDQGDYGFAYRNQLTGVLEGFEIDMAKAVASAIFGDPNKIQYKVVVTDQRLPAVQNGSVDLVADTVTITCQRQKQVDFSTVYYDAGQRVLVRKDSAAKGMADLSGKKVCAAAGSTSIQNIKTQYPHVIPVTAAFATDCLALMQEGLVDAVSTDDAILAGLAAQDPDVAMVGPRFSDEPYGLGIANTHPDFVRFVNAVLAQIKSNGYWADSYRRWIGNPAPAPPAAQYNG